MLTTPIRWIRDRLRHKLSHLSLEGFREILKKHGPALLVIFVFWEIIEDVLFPTLFIWLGVNIHPIFAVGAPISWLLCFHWIAVPVTWGLWVKLRGKRSEK